MRFSTLYLVCALCAFAPSLSFARAIRFPFDSEGDPPVSSSTGNALQSSSQGNVELSSDTLHGVQWGLAGAGHRLYGSNEDGLVDSEHAESSQSWDSNIVVSFEDRTQNDNSDPGPDSDEKDFASSPVPVNEGKWRAGILGILAAIAATTALGYGVYTRRERVRELISQLPPIPFSITRLKYMQLPTLRIPTFSPPQRTRRHRRLRRNKAGFRPHISRSSRTWTDTEGGLLYDYDYDGDYERGPRHDILGSPSSSSSDSYAQEAEAFDLGAEEDFMIGAPRRASRSPSSPTSGSNAGKLRKGMGTVWGRWKRPSGKSGKRGKRGGSANISAGEGNGGSVLFAVIDGDEELETDEALPLAPTPHRFGVMKGYGSAG